MPWGGWSSASRPGHLVRQVPKSLTLKSKLGASHQPQSADRAPGKPPRMTDQEPQWLTAGLKWPVWEPAFRWRGRPGWLRGWPRPRCRGPGEPLPRTGSHTLAGQPDERHELASASAAPRPFATVSSRCPAEATPVPALAARPLPSVLTPPARSCPPLPTSPCSLQPLVHSVC